ncbi:hypothetical protein Pres01_48430 [Metapseudomonas resinovorans]|uniref:hypothetical protein n=1 Tax=Metapseudomonas resinovorans TaxID=53412 RepID=UPI000985E8BA|nr:hypothetical protein [Pseudomonas resinovorans]GLZ88792.1 hypothetical protein Pres01_48430 [Pseudomonas resinovorans]
MPVRLDNIPPLAVRPRSPRPWLWLGLLVIALLAGFLVTLAFADELLRQDAQRFWRQALGLPFALWSVSIALRCLVHVGVVSAADGWDRAREEDWRARLRRGRRSQQILATSLHTALRGPADSSGREQHQALLGDQSALKTQPLRDLPEQACRHSRLSLERGTQVGSLDHERLLEQVYRMVLADLAEAIWALPPEQLVALVLDIDSPVAPQRTFSLWQEVWTEQGLRQRLTPFSHHGLSAIDLWLDTCSQDPSLLLVVSARIAPSPPDDTAEVAVGLLLGNRRTRSLLHPVAYLHRPEQERETTADSLRRSIHQALEWVPMDADALGDAWLTGIGQSRQAGVVQAFLELSVPLQLGQGLHDLQASLGACGSATPWVAIAAAAESARTRERPQLIVSGGAVEAGLWCSVVTPVAMLESE